MHFILLIKSPVHVHTTANSSLMTMSFRICLEFVSKDVAIKTNVLLYRIINEQINKKGLVLFLFPYRAYVLDI